MSRGPAGDASDAAVIESSWSDPEAFRVIFERYYDLIHRYLVRRLGPDEAPDVASETFVTAFVTRRRFDLSYESARPWLFGIAHNVMRNETRRVNTQRRRLRVVAVDTGEFVDDVAWHTDVARLVERSGLASAVKELRAEDRDVLFLFAFGDLTYREIAQVLDIPVGTVRSRLSRLRAKLAPLLPDAGGGS